MYVATTGAGEGGNADTRKAPVFMVADTGLQPGLGGHCHENRLLAGF